MSRDEQEISSSIAKSRAAASNAAAGMNNGPLGGLFREWYEWYTRPVDAHAKMTHTATSDGDRCDMTQSIARVMEVETANARKM